jgi:hypothetical protein
MTILRKVIILLSFVIVGFSLINGAASKAYAQIFPPPNSLPPPVLFPQQSFVPSQSFPLLPPPQTTFPPSLFPNTQSFVPSTSFAIPTGSLSPWFPSIPAIACGGEFSLSIVGNTATHISTTRHGNNDGHNDDHNNKNTIALQIKAAGGTSLNQNSISGEIFQGSKNIQQNKGNNFNIKSVSNDCQVVQYSR